MTIGWIRQARARTGGLHDPDDIVRLEMAAALERDIQAIQVLVEGCTLVYGSASH